MNEELQKIVDESRAREAKAAEAPWVLEGTGSIPDIAFYEFDNGMTAQPTDDERFIAGARIMEPVWREAFVVALGALDEYAEIEESKAKRHQEQNGGDLIPSHAREVLLRLHRMVTTRKTS